MFARTTIIALALFLTPAASVAEEAIVAVAANFLRTAERLAERYEAESGHEITITHGATGQIYAQIKNGAPFDVFLAADAARPALLEDEGRVVDRATYALGQLVLVSRIPVTLGTAQNDFEGRTVALADPTVAPYGLAATSAMENLRLDTATFRAVLVSDVGQVASLFATGNAELAFVAESLLPLLEPDVVLPLEGRHPPIRQDGVLLSRGANNAAATGFWRFLKEEAASEIIRAAGYGRVE